LASPATAAHSGVSPDVTGFYDATTGSIQYVVADPVTRKSAISPRLRSKIRLNANDVGR
jgi:hypothetical protein